MMNPIQVHLKSMRGLYTLESLYWDPATDNGTLMMHLTTKNKEFDVPFSDFKCFRGGEPYHWPSHPSHTKFLSLFGKMEPVTIRSVIEGYAEQEVAASQRIWANNGLVLPAAVATTIRLDVLRGMVNALSEHYGVDAKVYTGFWNDEQLEDFCSSDDDMPF